MRDLLFATPWWLPTTVIVVGILLLWSGNRRQDKTLLRLGLAIGLLGIAVALISYFVDTDVEKVERRTRQLVTAVNSRDWTTFSSLLDPTTNFAIYRNRDELVDGARKTADAIGLKKTYVTSLETHPSGTSITVDMNALSEQDRTMDQPVITSWRLMWRREGDDWLLYRVEALPNMNFRADQITRELIK